MAQEFLTPVINKRMVADNTLEMTFQIPLGYDFRPGQYAYFTIPTLPAEVLGGNDRIFSFVNPPDGERLVIALRLRNTPYKEALNAMDFGQEILVGRAIGFFDLHQDSRPAILVAGGIGIAPFLSLLNGPQRPIGPIYLFYANQNLASAAYMAELQTRADITFIPIITRDSTNQWGGEHGHLTPEMIQRYVPEYNQGIYYLAGSPQMTQDVQDTLTAIAIPLNQIKQEAFTGY